MWHFPQVAFQCHNPALCDCSDNAGRQAQLLRRSQVGEECPICIWCGQDYHSTCKLGFDLTITAIVPPKALLPKGFKFHIPLSCNLKGFMPSSECLMTHNRHSSISNREFQTPGTNMQHAIGEAFLTPTLQKLVFACQHGHCVRRSEEGAPVPLSGCG